MSQGIVTVAYIGATILFILALGGLSRPETSRRGNYYGMVGMLLALMATIIGIVSNNFFILFIGIIIGGAIGLTLAKKVEMTQMPELVAILHSLVGLAAVLVGFANFMDHTTILIGIDNTIHNTETYLGDTHRWSDFFGFDCGFSQIECQDQRQATAAAGTSLAQFRVAHRSILAGSNICQTIGCGRRSCSTHPHDAHRFSFRSAYGHGDRRCRYACSGIHAQQLFRMGSCGNWIYVKQ